VGLAVSDLEASTRFYVDLVGMDISMPRFRSEGDWIETLTDNKGAQFDGVMLTLEDFTLQLVQYFASGIAESLTGHNRVGNLHFCFNVDDVDRKHRELADRKELRATPIVTLPGGRNRSFYVRDPDGVPVEFVGPRG
jgi:catechol 2,3-dioxygenase-like lactoylglutathione lyase family enzyme